MKVANKDKKKQWCWLTIIALLVIVVFLGNQAKADVTPGYKKLKYPPLAPITIPSYERYQLDNGMVVYLMEDHSLPLISGTVLLKMGSIFDPPSQVGLAELTGELLRLGGTVHYSPEQLNAILEQKAASIETSVTRTSASISFSSLSYDIDTVLPIFAEILQSPRFDSQQLELLKTQVRGTISRRNDYPGDIARREFAKLIYGQDSPYARVIEYVHLDNIQREDIQRFYRQYVRPEAMILGMVGDFDSAKMKQLIQRLFASWHTDSTMTPDYTISEPQQATTEGVFIVNRPQLTQSHIILGHIGVKLGDANYPVLSVINGVLNGFGGRLFKEIRSRQGLAYSVFGSWQANYDYPGVFIAGGQTKSETTTQFIRSIIEEIQRLCNSPITDTELDYAKDSILNSFVFQFQHPSQTLSRLMTYEYYGYPQDFIFQYQQGVKNTSREDVLRVAQKYFQPDKIVTLIVGNENAIKADLITLGKNIQEINITN
ncbi:MAG: insulinase family protein [Geminocystis sp.]|nr:insulinase family protein [Geminocystis sp.]HIK36834.1 insulinase family protein [Geminocystis sp. M7585_C2015_104]MCS7148054.1 insulinase family protein [Geminocystis sp.]MCX8077798.1 insulinase family protein [Geminocystis sp.]MDW8116406.1 pitrilysin family protein [Geminocystis sp.]